MNLITLLLPFLAHFKSKRLLCLFAFLLCFYFILPMVLPRPLEYLIIVMSALVFPVMAAIIGFTITSAKGVSDDVMVESADVKLTETSTKP